MSAAVVDVFVCSEATERAEALSLRAALVDRGIRAFSHHKDVVPGDRCDEVIERALSRARLVAVVVSGAWGAARGGSAREEVAWTLARLDGDASVRVVPVFVSGAGPQHAPFGISRFKGIEEADADWVCTASELARALDGPSKFGGTMSWLAEDARRAVAAAHGIAGASDEDAGEGGAFARGEVRSASGGMVAGERSIVGRAEAGGAAARDGMVAGERSVAGRAEAGGASRHVGEAAGGAGAAASWSGGEPSAGRTLAGRGGGGDGGPAVGARVGGHTAASAAFAESAQALGRVLGGEGRMSAGRRASMGSRRSVLGVGIVPWVLAAAAIGSLTALVLGADAGGRGMVEVSSVASGEVFAPPASPPSGSAEARVAIARVTASSTQRPLRQGGRTYRFGANNLVDGDLRSSWQERSPGIGVGQWVDLELGGAAVVTRIELANGFQWRDDPHFGDLYRLNGRLLRVEVVADGRSWGSHAVADRDGWQSIVLPEVPARTLRLVIVDAVAGARWYDTAISELRVFGRRRER